MRNHWLFSHFAGVHDARLGNLDPREGGLDLRCMARGFGGHGRHGFRHFGFGGGGPGDLGFRAGRKLSSADLQLLLLLLLDERPRHGYDLIKAVEERSNGFYQPSPGVIYPALTYLEEAGQAVPEAEGARKLYRLTDTGRARLTERRAEADGILRQLEELGRRMDRVREAFGAGEGGEEPEGEEPFERGPWARAPELRAARHDLRAALNEKRGAGPEELARIAGVLRRAADEIRGG
jgi:DNA-binding PadR family transcriptional regulator